MPTDPQRTMYETVNLDIHGICVHRTARCVTCTRLHGLLETVW